LFLSARYFRIISPFFGKVSFRLSITIPELPEQIARDATTAKDKLGALGTLLAAGRVRTHARTYTHVSSRKSSVHFYYSPLYDRKSLPHADSRCAEGRRAIAGVW